MRRPRLLLLGAGLALGLLALRPGAAQVTRQLTPVAAPPADTPAPGAPPELPSLRISADFHTQVVNRFAQDRGSRIVVTGSDDKTIRIWQASDGAPLATLRVPIGAGDEGAIYALAISPDDKTLLVGGNTGYAWDRSFTLYVFDLATQQFKGRLPNLPGPVNDIAFSPDGGSIAIAMGSGGGMWLVSAKTGSTIKNDGTFQGRVTSVAFARDGRLYAASFNGEVHAYDKSGQRIVDRTPVPGGNIHRIAVSPDGRTLAVGYASQPRVELLEARDLTPRASMTNGPDGKRETAPAGLGAVAWAEDGTLMAAGSLRGADGSTILRRWRPGATRPVDWSGLRDTVFQIGPTDDGGVLMVGADPAMLRLDANGRTVFRKESPGLDFRDVRDRLFRVSSDGFSVQLQTKRMDEPWTFDLAQRRIGPPRSTRALVPVAAPSEPAAPPPPPPSGPRPQVTDWRNTPNPRIDGKALRLEPAEIAHSYAINPAGSLVLIGTDYKLRVYDRGGQALNAVDLPGAVWAVGVSGDGKMAVAAVSDGTLRWFGLGTDGELTPRASLFATADARRWVAWSPSGYFDTAETGGEGLVGLLLNHAKNQAPEWFSFSQVYRRFYAPETVNAALRGIAAGEPGDGLATVRQSLAKAPPPAIELAELCWTLPAGRECRKLANTATSRQLSTRGIVGFDAELPAEASRVSLRYRLRGNTDRSDVDIFVNGRNSGRATRDVSAAGDVLVEQSAALDPGNNRVQLRAYDRDQQTYAESRVIQIVRAQAAVASGKPTIFILSVGVNDYMPGINHLDFAVPDARSVANTIKAHVPSGYGNVELIPLYNAQATTDGVVKALADIANRATSRDTVLIYLSGHGTTIDGRYYYVTQNVPSVEKVGETALSETELVGALAQIKSNNTMLFLDTCHAGAFSLDSTSKLAHETGRYVLAAAQSVEEALDSYDGRNGVFATAVLRGLAGQAASGKGEVNNFDLGLYVQPLVSVLATELKHNQSARFKIAADDAQPFAIVQVKPAN